MRTTRRAAHGFTLIEILVVVVIITIMGGIVGMGSADNSMELIRGASIEIQDCLETAQIMAISNRDLFGVVFEVGGRRVAVVDANGNPVVDPLTQGDYILDYDVHGPLYGITIKSAVFGAAGNAAIFDSQGMPLAGGSLTIGHKTSSLTLQLDAATGQISMP